MVVQRSTESALRADTTLASVLNKASVLFQEVHPVAYDSPQKILCNSAGEQRRNYPFLQ